jgi:hypothetical protein
MVPIVHRTYFLEFFFFFFLQYWGQQPAGSLKVADLGYKNTHILRFFSVVVNMVT